MVYLIGKMEFKFSLEAKIKKQQIMRGVQVPEPNISRNYLKSPMSATSIKTLQMKKTTGRKNLLEPHMVTLFKKVILLIHQVGSPYPSIFR